MWTVFSMRGYGNLVLLPMSKLLILFSTGLIVYTENTVFNITNHKYCIVQKYVKDFNKSDTIYSFSDAIPFKPQKMERKMDNQLNIR